MLTQRLREAIDKIESLSAEEQDAIASRWLAEAEDGRIWDEKFRLTTDEQWDRMAAAVRREIAADGTLPLEDVFRAREAGA